MLLIDDDAVIDAYHATEARHSPWRSFLRRFRILKVDDSREPCFLKIISRAEKYSKREVARWTRRLVLKRS